MIGQENRRQWVPKTAELTLTAGLAAIYSITAYLPLSKFIGGPGFITLEILMLPIIGALMRSLMAITAVFGGSLVAALGKTRFTAAFVRDGLVIPLIALVTRSIAFHFHLRPDMR